MIGQQSTRGAGRSRRFGIRAAIWCGLATNGLFIATGLILAAYIVAHGGAL